MPFTGPVDSELAEAIKVAAEWAGNQEFVNALNDVGK
jgi:hypothetical protein